MTALNPKPSPAHSTWSHFFVATNKRTNKRTNKQTNERTNTVYYLLKMPALGHDIVEANILNCLIAIYNCEHV
jgi:hypothetical protein